MLRESGPEGIEPATYESQVQRPIAKPPRNTLGAARNAASVHFGRSMEQKAIRTPTITTCQIFSL